MTTHARYPYSPIAERRVYDWPQGKRLAISVGRNLEWFSFGEGLGAEIVGHGRSNCERQGTLNEADERALIAATTAGAIAAHAAALPDGTVT